MKKRILAVLAALSVILCACACTGGADEPSQTNSGQTDSVQTSESAVSELESKKTGINLTVKDGMYTIIMPVDYISFGEATPEEYAREKGYESITLDEMCVNYLITMNEEKYEQSLKDVQESFEQAKEAAAQADGYIEDITVNDDYSKVEIIINRQEYALSGKNTAEAAVTLGTYATIYRAYAGFDPVTVVNTVYSDTQEIAFMLTVPTYS